MDKGCYYTGWSVTCSLIQVGGAVRLSIVIVFELHPEFTVSDWTRLELKQGISMVTCKYVNQ